MIIIASTSIPDARSVELPLVGAKPGAISGEPLESLMELYDDGQVQVGIWECTPGVFTSRRDGYDEFMQFLAGNGVIYGDDGVEHRVTPGASILLRDGWSGRWEIDQTVRKAYTIIRHTN
jgi:uncharacterized protein